MNPRRKKGNLLKAMDKKDKAHRAASNNDATIPSEIKDPVSDNHTRPGQQIKEVASQLEPMTKTKTSPVGALEGGPKDEIKDSLQPKQMMTKRLVKEKKDASKPKKAETKKAKEPRPSEDLSPSTSAQVVRNLGIARSPSQEREERNQKKIHEAAELKRKEAEALLEEKALERRHQVREWLIKKALEDKDRVLTRAQLEDKLKGKTLEEQIKKLLHRRLKNKLAIEKKRLEELGCEMAGGDHEPRQDTTTNQGDHQEEVPKSCTPQTEMDALVDGPADKKKAPVATKGNIKKKDALQMLATNPPANHPPSPSGSSKKLVVQRRKRMMKSRRSSSYGARSKASGARSNNTLNDSSDSGDDEKGSVVSTSSDEVAIEEPEVPKNSCIPVPIRTVRKTAPDVESACNGHKRLCGGDNGGGMPPLQKDNLIAGLSELIQFKKTKCPALTKDEETQKEVTESLKTQMAICARRLISILKTNKEEGYNSGLVDVAEIPVDGYDIDLINKLLAIARRINQYVGVFVTKCPTSSVKWRASLEMNIRYHDLVECEAQLMADVNQLTMNEAVVQWWWICCRSIYLLRDLYIAFGDKKMVLIVETIRTIDWFYMQCSSQKDYYQTV
ncbi:axoneme-associated protein mst101(2)-like isoform X2 [Drosophila bipectinata]|uniref:axoneme-associated protein mst101(2)-like isoform X2 n=1 Tax=Drosophila bipectinata TaxID=42026 RepID=UPI0038B2BEC7